MHQPNFCKQLLRVEHWVKTKLFATFYFCMMCDGGVKISISANFQLFWYLDLDADLHITVWDEFWRRVYTEKFVPVRNDLICFCMRL